jgi:citronellol/citronellal dehydrogenase
MGGRLDGKVAIVTGASRGIGRAMALGLAREGATVVIAAKSEKERRALPGTIHSVAEEVRSLGGEALPIRVDVSRDEQVAAMASEVEARLGRADVLVNNAGALWWKDVLHTPMSRFDLVMGVNARAAFACTQALLPLMLRGGGGHVVVCSPPIDLAALPGRVAYLMSKFGMTMLALGLAEELRDRGVAVNALWPVTLIESQATINYRIGGPRTWRKADILADALLELVTTAPADITGRALLDEDFLRERGFTDFTRYRCDPEHEPPRLAAADLPEVGHVPLRRTRDE